MILSFLSFLLEFTIYFSLRLVSMNMYLHISCIRFNSISVFYVHSNEIEPIRDREKKGNKSSNISYVFFFFSYTFVSKGSLLQLKKSEIHLMEFNNKRNTFNALAKFLNEGVTVEQGEEKK